MPGNTIGTLDSWELDILKKDSSASRGTSKPSPGIIVTSVLVSVCVVLIAYLVFRLSRKRKTSDVALSKEEDTNESSKLPELATTSPQFLQEADGIQKVELEHLETVEIPDRNGPLAGYFTRAELDAESTAHEMEGSPTPSRKV